MSYSTIGGHITRGETYAKLTDHLREAQDCCDMMGHLHNTEGNDMDKTLAKGWLGMSQLLREVTNKITQLAANKLQ